MGFTEKDGQRATEIDEMLRPDAISELFITGYNDGFFAWYTRLLSTLVIATDGEKIVYAKTDIDGSSGRFVIATERAVMLAEVQDMSADETVHVQLAPVTALSALSVSAGMPYDAKGSTKNGWPGVLIVDATFEGLGLVRFHGNSYDRDRNDHVGDISRLLTMLRTQLGV